MRSRPLGRSGRVVSELGFGGAGVLMNQHAVVDDAEAEAVVAAALELGVTFFDTAPAYGDRLSERRLGRALAGCDDVLLATKTGLFSDGVDFSATTTRRSLEASLEALRRDRLSLVQLHEVGDDTLAAALDGAAAALAQARDEGLVELVGVTGSAPAPLLRAVESGLFDTVMVWRTWNLLDASAEPVVAAAAQRGMGVLAAAPFASGILATGARPGASLHYEPADADGLARVAALERESDEPLAGRALRFCLDDRVACVVAAVDDADQLRRNAALLA